MWAMIATCIALVIWTVGLLIMTRRAEKRRVVEGRGRVEMSEKSDEGAVEKI